MAKYRTIKDIAKGEYRDRGSRFYGYAGHIVDEAGANEFLNSIRKEHPKASHLCYAYNLTRIIGNYRVNDDREPAHTAGIPIYNQIRKHLLNNTIIAVVRYFGGVLLGKGGLIRAYGTAAEEAILNGRVIEIEEMMTKTIKINAESYPKTIDLLKKKGIHILDQTFNECWDVRLEFSADKEEWVKEVVGEKETGL
jgi:uncharacterized YigZ family protein